MKLKSLLSASLLLASLAGAAAARQRAAEFREGDAFRGPVKSVRSERALYGRLGGELVEGPRRLVATSDYAPGGKRREQESYARDGAVMSRRVFVYDDAGNEIEQTVFDGHDNLRARYVHRPAEGERLTYNGDGSLRERRVVSRRPDGTQYETRLYDGTGALKERSVIERDGKTSVWSTYRADGSLKKRDTHTLNYVGPHHTESETFAPDDTVVGRRVSDVDTAATDLRAVNDGHNPGPRKTRETREYDARKNLSKITRYVWNEATNDYEPSSVTYYTTTYYR